MDRYIGLRHGIELLRRDYTEETSPLIERGLYEFAANSLEVYKSLFKRKNLGKASRQIHFAFTLLYSSLRFHDPSNSQSEPQIKRFKALLEEKLFG